MKYIKFIIIILISLTSSIKAEIDKDILASLKEGNKLIFIRHAYAPGGGDPDNFDINDCNTQRNLSESGRQQAKNISNFFIENQINFKKVYSSEWCRCKETAKIAFGDFETKNFLNSFFSQKFAKNRKKQMNDLNNFVDNYKDDGNLVFVTHYVVISEALNYAPSSGEIVVADKKFNKISSFEIKY
ncbi:histidine phosphatase family protein [Candidatus Pelagibacter sp.]|nr:histidine phosphatase family protein [Candidatus Pelagibacter sp.]MDC0394166.1 histidine phosphatase family protein [Candidatus Pelagibacter sp.]MDC0460800.1 histidine phosphatase family protein [Candidatus Pelagibacter sp.]MDC0899270.1 histidine phosphatase family protein [Candidatus Pelagibacter sp.]